MQTDLNNSLIHAVHHGDLEKVMKIVNSYGLSYCPAWSEGYVVLRTAIKDERPEIAKFLLRKGAKTNSKSTMRGGTKSNTPLHYAVTNTTDVELVEMLLDRNAFIDAHNDRDETPLYLAIYSWKKYFVRLLLDRGANVNVKSQDETPLQTAMVRYGCFKDPELIEMLLNKNASVEEKNWRGKSPLHVAASEGYEACVRLFLNRKANVNVLDDCGVTPLLGACFKGFANIVELLLNAGASCEQSERSGISPLHLTSLKNNKEILCLLIDKVHDIDAIAATDLDHLRHYDFKLSVHEISGYSPLHIACQKDYTEIVELLLNKSADVNLVNKDNETPLHLAVKKQSLPLIQCILKYNPDVVDENNIAALKTAVCANGENSVNILNILIHYGFSFSTKNMGNPELLHAVVKKGLKKMVDSILTSGVDFKRSLGGCTLLHTAAQSGRKEIVKLFINAGCDVNAKDNEGRTPINYFMDHLKHDSCAEVVKLLLDSDKNFGRPSIAAFLPNAVDKECFQVCEALVKNYGADVNFMDDCNKTPLLYICGDCSSQSLRSKTHLGSDATVKRKIAELLLKHGAKVNVGNSIDETALHGASFNGYEDLVQLLLDRGADINAVTSEGASSLHMAVRAGHRKIVELLVSSGANVNAFSHCDGTPLHIAASKGDTDLVVMLLQHDADIDQQDSSGKTALHAASSNDHVEVVNALLHNRANVNIMCKRGRTALNNAKAPRPDYKDQFYSDEEYDVPCRPYKQTVREALNLHIVKLDMAGFYICAMNLNDIPFHKFHDFIEECQDEIDELKDVKLCCHITVYYILLENRKLTYLNDEKLMETLNSESSPFYRFPIYGDLLESNFEHDKLRKKLLLPSCEWFLSLIKTSNALNLNKLPILPMEIIEKILLYLDNRTLKSVISCAEQLLNQFKKPSLPVLQAV